MHAVVAALGVFILLVFSELLWRAKVIRGESARKLVHIIVGSFVAFWPYFMGWREIQLMSLAFLVVVILSQQLSVFHAVHAVQRKTWGEVFFAVGIGAAAFVQPPPIIFTAAILHMALADGAAALVGKRFGLLHEYRVGNYTKTLPGTCAFWVVSTGIVVATIMVGRAEFGWPLWPLITLLPILAALVENIAPWGTDNLFVPLVVIGVLQTLSVHA
jgi:phytol kinase